MKNFFIACVILASASFTIASCSSSEAKSTYQCPMKCEGDAVMYDAPGKCPVCNMELAELK